MTIALNMATLTIITGPDRGRVIELEQTDRPIVIGRKSSDIVLRNAAVSRSHAQVLLRGGKFELTDCGSANGTFVNDIQIHGTVTLTHNDQIRCGSTVLLFKSEQHPFEQPSHRGDKAVGSAAETMVGLTVGELISKESARQRQQVAQAGLKALNISHGIKNLLQTVQSGREVVDCALGIEDIERAKRGWKILNRSLDQINTLILDLLKFSKDSKLQLEPASLNRIIERIVQTVIPTAGKKNITINLKTDDEIGPLEIDSDKISEAILNLILNAVEAVDAPQGRIEITTELDTPSRQAMVRITDDGPGIEDVNAIFEPFYSTGKKTHTGLGLPVAKKIITQHNGTIEVQSKPGKGATFTIKLPHR